MDNLDINIYNYDLDEILNLFGLEYNFNKEDLILCREIVLKVHPSKSELKPSFFHFYSKALKIVECLNEIRKKKLLLNASYYPNPSDDTYFLKKILEIKDFEKIEDNEILINKIYKDDKNDIVYKALEEVKKSQALPPYHRPIVSDTSKDDINYVNTHENNIVSSSLNSIKRITQTKNLHFNSCFRTKYYTTNPADFQYHFPSEVKNVVSMRLSSIEVPNSWYLFSHNRNNNKMSIQVTDLKCNEISDYIIVIPDGNYDCDSLVHYINTTYLCESNSNDHKELRNIKFNIDNYNFKSKFEIIKNKDIEEKIKISLNFIHDNNNNIMDTLGWILGFRLANYKDIDDAIQSEGIFDAGGDRYIYFCLDDYQYNKNESNIILFEETSIDSSVLAKIPMIDGKLSLIINENDGYSLTKTRRYNGPVNLRKIHVKLLDRFGDTIDLNKMDFSFTIEMELLYERNKVI